VIALENGGTNELDNFDVTCGWCKPKKDAEDHKKAAKSRSVVTKHLVPKSERKKRGGFHKGKLYRSVDGSVRNRDTGEVVR